MHSFATFLELTASFFHSIFRLNMYTSPAYFMAFVCAGTLYCLVTYFSERQRIPTQQTKKVSAKRAAIDDVANSMTMCGMLTVYDGCILGCMLLNIATKGSIASFETLGISYAGTHFGLPSQQAGVLVATCGSVGVIALLSMGTFAKYFSDIQLICGGMAVMAVGIISLTGFNELEDEGIENPKWRYFLAIFMIYSVGYPIGHTAVIGMFSKSKLRCIVQSHKGNHVCVQDLTLCFSVVGRRPQGLLLGYFASAGSLARIFFPILSGFIANFEDIVVMFIILVVVLVVAIGFVTYNGRTLSMLSS